MSIARVPHVNTHPTGKIESAILLFALGSRLDEFLQGFVVDVGRCPFRDLVSREVSAKLHDVGIPMYNNHNQQNCLIRLRQTGIVRRKER